MITPRETRLIRTPHLRAFQRATAEVACEGDPAARRGRVVIVPTRAAADMLRRTLEHVWLDAAGAGGRPAALVLPDLVTRAEWYRGLRERLRGARPLVTDLEREVIFRRAARAATDGGFAPPFAVRSGLVAAILEFYDGLRRRRQSIDAFERLTVESLERGADIDRGAVRMLQQTRFLVAAFRAYDRLLDESGLADEHTLREALLEGVTAPPLAHAVVTVADEVVDGRGLWPADFDLLTRLPGLARIDVVATEGTLATGWHERLHTLLPGIVDTRAGTGDARVPQIVAPPEHAGRLHWVVRDREEELADAARRAKGLARREHPGALDRFAVVFQRPLPYVYLARQIFGAAGVPYQASDALPLAAEPFAAAIDLVFSAAVAGFSRGAVVALLRSPHFRFHDDERAIAPEAIGALDAVFQQIRFLGGRDRLAEVAADLDAGRLRGGSPSMARAAASAARAIAGAADALAPLERHEAPSGQLAALAAFIRRHEVLPEPDAPWCERHLRARAAILGALDALGAAHARYDDHPRPFADLAGTIRRWIETQTFSPRTGRAGVHLVDASAARYGDFDEVRLVGLVDSDWPEAIPRTVFYPTSLLAQLGWPQERERRLGARSVFLDLLHLAPLRVSLSTLTLEDDALARPSSLLEDLTEAGLPVVHEPGALAPRIFTYEALSEEPVEPAAVSGEAALWLALRARRPPASSPAFHGTTDPRRDPVYRPSAVERYLQCPFKYFADRVLRLEEEREEEPGLTPQERGLLLHEILQEFFAAWRDAGRGSITVENVGEALAEFSRVAETRLAALGDADRALERARLLGSAVATGLAERAFEFEIGSGAEVVERLLEHPLEGTFTLQGPDGPRQVGVRGKADRIDLLHDGTLRVIDYKLGRAPKLKEAIQLPVYGACAEQQLSGHRGRTWIFGAAGYVAFGDPRSFVPLETRGTSFAEAVREGQARFVEAIQGIERGSFPVRPAEPYRCAYCAYPSVCRKDYVGDE